MVNRKFIPTGMAHPACHRGAFILVGVFLLVAVGAVAAGCSGTAQTPKGTPAAVTFTETVVTAKGAIVPARYARLSFSIGGTVAKSSVKEGDQVKAGDVIAQVDTKDLELQVKVAKDALVLAQASVTQAKTPASAQEIAAAEADYNSAAAALTRAQRGPSVEEVAILKAQLAKAKAALDLAQATYDRAGGASNPFAGLLATTLQLQTATLDYQIAQANYDKATKLDPTMVAQAQAAVDAAKARLELKKSGPRKEDIAVAEVRVQQAQTALEQAQNALPKAKLVAPFDGTLTTLNLREGELVQAGAPLVTIADLSQLRVETTDLDEFGAAKIKIGQAVKVIVNAFSNKTLSAKVTNIAQQSVMLATGDVAYVVTLALDKQDPELRWGMTVKVQFEQ